MLVEYKGKRFRVSDMTYESYRNDYPERAECLKKIKESEEYYNYTKLKQLIEPTDNEIKECIIKNYVYAEDKYDDATMKMDTDMMEKYFGAKEMTRKIGKELISYDPELKIYSDEIKEYREKKKQKDEEYENWKKNLQKYF